MSITNANYEVSFAISYWSHIIRTLTIMSAKYFDQPRNYCFVALVVSTKMKFIALNLPNIHLLLGFTIVHQQFIVSMDDLYLCLMY